QGGGKIVLDIPIGKRTGQPFELQRVFAFFFENQAAAAQYQGVGNVKKMSPGNPDDKKKDGGNPAGKIDHKVKTATDFSRFVQLAMLHGFTSNRSLMFCQLGGKGGEGKPPGDNTARFAASLHP
ncbi:MAG: hypothetical protein CO107_15410, partial [Deltaproteobacteria bacterium CG_4_9_14_3_um_filter_51_14]